eukprot:SM000010S04323  [mRNA]  locus=s10:934582:948443:- [translate_table: standard]
MAAGGPSRGGDAAASGRNAAAMPDFFALLQELVGLTACEAPAPELRSVEARFRAALPKIMRRFFAPANGASVKERELQAVLKLLAHITKHCPGVFHCSDGAAIILLVIGYLLPCFAEQLFKGMGQPLFEALAGLLSLLWKENRQLYILFFVDLLRLLEDLASVASFFSKPSLFTDCTEVSVQAFSSTYLAAVENASDDVSALWPDRISLPGVMLNLTGKERWQPVATWMINLAHHCLMEGASHISGLVGPTTFDIIMSFLSFDEPSLHKETEVTSQTVQLLGLLFEAIDKLLTWHVTRPSLHESCHRSILRWEDLLREDLWEPMAFGRFLLLPWTLTLEDDIHSYSGMLKIKLRATRLAASAYNATLEKGLQKILRAGLEDKEAQLRAASVILMAGLVPLLDKTSITQCWMSVRSLARDPADTVRWSVARAIGLAGCCSAGCTVKCLKHTHQSGECECNKISRKQEIDSVLGPAAACASLEHPSCSLCDAHNRTPYVRTPPGSAEVEIGGVLAAEPVHHCEDPDVSILWQSLSQQLLFEEQSSKVQAEFVLSGGRILRHALPEVLKQGSTIWLRFLDQVPLHPDWTVRAAFGSISGTHFTHNPPCRFMSLSALEGLFGDMSEQAGSNFELTDATEVKRQALEMLSNLRSHFRNAKQPEIRQTLMTAVKEVARACAKGSELLFFCLVLLLEQLDSSLPFLTSAAIDSIKQIACLHWPQSRPSSVHGMLETFKEELYDYLSSCLISQPVLVMVFAEEVMSVSLKELVKSMTPMVIPKLVIEQHGNEQALAVLRRIAEVLDLELPQLLVDWAHKVLACALPQADSDVLLRVLSFYEEVTASGYLDLFRAVIEALLVELVFILGDATTAENPHRSERVASTFKKITRIMSDSEDLPSFLREYLVGILNSIEYKLLRANELDLKRKGLRCIDKLADFIGPHLSAFVPKFTGLLTNALEVAALQVQALGVWRRFIRILATVAPLKLRSIASQIVVAVLPCLELADDGKDELKIAATADVLEELAVKNKDILRDTLQELPLLPRLEALKNVNNVLQEVRGSLSLCQQLQQATEGLRHENLSINYVAASELKILIREHRHGVDTLVTTESSSQAEAISQLVAALLRICTLDSRSPLSQRLRLLCAECLGELGAVDPGRLQVELPQRPHIDRDDDDLIFELINEHLAKAFRSAPDGEVQDAAALAIQELLKVCGCAPPCTGQIMPSAQGRNGSSKSGPHCDDLRLERGGAASSRRGEQLWQRFSEDVRDIIAPCLTSRFVLSRPKSNPGSAVPGPLYSHGLTFRRWVYLWGRHLLSSASSSRSKIFNCCKAIFKNDMGVALFLLPYIVLDVISTGNQAAKDEVCQEILAVLVAPTTGEDREACAHGVVNVGAADADSDASVWEVATQLIFTLLDSLGQWVDRTKQNLRQDSAQQAEDFKSKSRSRKIEDKALQCQHVEELLAAIPKEALARASYRCKAYARALLYFEFHVRERCGTLNPAAEKSGSFCAEDVSFLLEMYSGLDEPDGLAGLSRLRGSVTSLQDQMLIHEKAGNWAEALTCYEQALETTPHGLKLHQGVLGCLLNMGHLQALVTQVDGLIARLPGESKLWSTYGLQAAWRLGQWDRLEEYLESAESQDNTPGRSTGPDFNTALASILAGIHSQGCGKDTASSSFEEQVKHCRMNLLTPLAAAGMESYSRAYPLLVRLHMLRELEDFHRFRAGTEAARLETDRQLLRDWDGRLKITQPSLWAREPILSLRRLICKNKKMPVEVGLYWLKYAEMCRKAGHYQTARRAVLEARAHGAPNSHLESARLLWATDCCHMAIAELQEALLAAGSYELLGEATRPALGGLVQVAQHSASMSATKVRELELPGEQVVQMTARTLLQLARWVHHTGQKQKEEVVALYLRVKELQPKWEKAFFYMAKYYDDLLCDARRRQDEATPDYTILAYIRGCKEDLPAYQWLTALPQLVSRICHQNEGVLELTKQLITEVLRRYPQQALWTMAAVSKSALAARRQAATDVLDGAKNSLIREEDRVLFTQFPAFIEQMIRLCFHAGQPKQKVMSISSDFGQLKRMMPLDIVLPLQGALTVAMPPDGLTDRGFNAFPVGEHATILGICEDVEILQSLQRPKKVVLLGSDGREHPFLCKPKDDLRKDARMMEFTTMINRLLSKNSVSRRRNLHIRTFAVLPLTEDCGMIEWVLHTRGLRHILQQVNGSALILWTLSYLVAKDIYMACGKFDRQKTNPTIKKIYDQMADADRSEAFRTRILSMFPPMFHKWLLNTFTEPAAWFRARMNFAHTAAVWSMVGHIVGLGDRHGENILLDSTDGACVHVDFSCLFDKGLALEKPELVPFRLTQNMVDGLGITGYEGVFLRVCEITLNVLRVHRETLINVLETFIHDPLVEWTKSHKSSGTEIQNPHAQRALANIKDRLQGVVVGVNVAPSLPLSVEGQAHRLITLAVSHDNLSKMYIWWMPWF